MTTPERLPFTWGLGGIHADVVVGLAVLATAYALAWRRGPRRSAAEPALFLTGILVLLAALNGPLHDLSDGYLFSAHMVQHLLLTLVVPPLWLAGTPGFMVDAVLARLWSPLRAVARWLTRPVPALGGYAVALVVWHLPGAYEAALRTHAWHVVEHLVLLGTATAAWWPVLGRSALAPRVHYGAQILYLFAFGVPMTVVAAMITGAEHVLYPFYAEAPRLWGLTPLVDQRIGGLIMWVPAGLIPLAAFTIVFFRWAAAEADEAPAASR